MRLPAARVLGKSFSISSFVSREMFSQRFSPTTGRMEWVVEDEDYDMRNEIARSSYADMLHDDERNKKYFQATKEAVSRLKNEGRKVHMLDIGTGTGLLAMMAAQSGADKCTACEAFEPIAKAAKQIVKKNKFVDNITVIGKCSTDLSTGKDGDMQGKANLLVTELWDTELIGEGALPTLRDACQRLLEPGFVSVPAAATIYVQVVESDLLWNMHQLNHKQVLDNQGIHLPEAMQECRGSPSAFDLHIDELQDEQIQTLTSPIPVVRFDFCSHCKSKKSDCPNRVSLPDTKDNNAYKVVCYNVKSSVRNSGLAHGVVMWWSLNMDVDGLITLSTAPRWVHPDGNKKQWRDHWMQAVYFLRKPLFVQEGEKLNVQCCHDNYSIWFDVMAKHQSCTPVDRPLCTCGAHVTWSRHRFAMINDSQRSLAFKEALKQFVVEGNSSCLCISDGSLLPVIAAKAGFEKVFSAESSLQCQKLIKQIVELNGLVDKVQILSKQPEELSKEDTLSEEVDVIVGEPFFTSALFPWHNLYFWYAAASVAKISKRGVKVLPWGATLKAIAVQFQDLWKFHAPLNIVEGFDVSFFDQLIEGSKVANEDLNTESSSGIALEPHHVWEYPCRALTQEFTVMKFDFTQPIPDNKIKTEGKIQLARSGICHGVVLWMDFHLTDTITVTTGLVQKQEQNQERTLNWVKHTKQGVYFMRLPIKICTSSVIKDNVPSIKYNVSFEPSTGEIDFNFQLDSNEETF